MSKLCDDIFYHKKMKKKSRDKVKNIYYVPFYSSKYSQLKILKKAYIKICDDVCNIVICSQKISEIFFQNKNSNDKTCIYQINIPVAS